MMKCKVLGSLCAIAVLGLTALVAHPARAQEPPSPVQVIPLVRSAAIQFRLDQVAPTLFSATDFGQLYDPQHKAMLEWRKPGETQWKRAQDFVRIQADRSSGANKPDPRMASMLFGLQEGSTYEYRISFSGTGYPSTTYTGQFTTLTTSPPTGTQKVIPITVSEKTTSADLHAALAAALSSSPADNAGKVIEIRSAAGPGVRTVVRAALSSIYVNGDWRWSGTPDAWLTVRTATGHNVIFDGSDPSYDKVNAGMWKPVVDASLGLQASDNVYVSATSMERPGAVFYERKPDEVGIRLLDCTEGERYLVPMTSADDQLGWTTGLHTSRSATILSLVQSAGSNRITMRTDRNPYLNPGQSVDVTGASVAGLNGRFTVFTAIRDTKNNVYEFQLLNPNAVAAQTASNGTVTPVTPTGTLRERLDRDGGFFIWVPDSDGATTGKIYVHLSGGVDPNTVAMKIPVIPSCLDLSACNHLIVEGLDMRYYGTGMSGRFGGIGMIDIADVLIRRNRMRCLTTYLGMRTSGFSYKNRVIMQANDMRERGMGPDPDDPSIPVPSWYWLKATVQETCGLNLLGRGISYIDNYMQGPFNGVVNYVGTQSLDYSGAQGQYPEGWEVDNNTFVGIGDDSIEPEQWCVNYAVTHNKFRACYKGISMAPIIGGPVYVARNFFLGRGEFAKAGDKQSFVKMGNDDPGDWGYKLVANNTIVNYDQDATGIPLVGIANSGATYNHFYYNNYVASDSYPIDMGYGLMGYPHIFDGNRYRTKRFGARIGSYDFGFALGRVDVVQGEPIIGSDHRNAATFQDWQAGRATNSAGNWPGYDGTVPQTPRTAMTAGTGPFPGQLVTWMHDPHGSFSEGDHELVAPFSGDFRPVPGSAMAGAGVPLANITFDCGPAWADAEETGRPTVGAIADAAARQPDLPPTVRVDRGVTATTGKPISVALTYSDSDGSVAKVTASVTDPDGNPVASDTTQVLADTSSVLFTPGKAGFYTVASTATDNKGLTGTDSATVLVTDGVSNAGPDGLQVTRSVSKTDPRPGEPVIYTIVCTNPTTRTITDLTLKETFPPEMMINTSSAALDGVPTGVALSGSEISIPIGTMSPGKTRTFTITAIVK